MQGWGAGETQTAILPQEAQMLLGWRHNIFPQFFAKDQFLVCWFSQLSALWLSYNYSLQWSQATAMPLTTENIFLHLLKACFSRKEPGNTPTSWQRAQWWGASQLQSKLRPHNQWAHPHRHASAGKLWPGPFRATHFQFAGSALLKAKLDFVGLMWVNFGNRGGEKLLNINLKCKILGALLFDFHLYIRPVVQY